ncbi:fibroblast growth factor receptor substrate 3 [Camelus ferus]|nr:fibroblast growth factor receptor substrate 3 [Camelus ferus]
MGSCCSCLNRDSVPDNHPTKFKVTNVDDEGVELGSGVMELTQSELVLHLHRREAVRWPYLCLRRYGYDSNLFSFESGRRCQTGQGAYQLLPRAVMGTCAPGTGIFAFKCSRAEEIFNLLQDLMQCNSINVMEEPVIITRNSHPAELDLPRAPQPPNALGYTVSSFSNGFPGCPGEGPRFSAPRRPSTSSLRHPSLGEESTHALIAPDEQSHTYVNTPASEDEHRRSRQCLQHLPEGRAPLAPQARGPDQRDPQVFLQLGQVKFVLGPTPARRHTVKCQGLCPSLHDAPQHNNNNEGPSECPAQPKCTYENVSSPRVFNFDFRRPGPEPPRQLNYIQVELKGWGGDRPKGSQNPSVPRAPVPTTHPARSSDSYAVIDLKKTVAMSNLQRALPRDDGTARKTRHNSTDLPL